jgi:hypothetical protein
MRRHIIGGLSALSLVFTTLVAGATTASADADVLDVTCTGSQHVTYSPGIVLSPERDVTTTVEGSYSCLSSQVSGATTYATFTGPESCLAVAEIETLTSSFTWNDGSTSTATYSTTVTYGVGTTVLTKTGTVTSGRFAGAAFLQVITGPNLGGLLACITETGLTENTETAVLEITSTQ